MDNKSKSLILRQFEELLWEIKDLTGVLEAIEYYNIIDYAN